MLHSGGSGGADGFGHVAIGYGRFADEPEGSAWNVRIQKKSNSIGWFPAFDPGYPGKIPVIGGNRTNRMLFHASNMKGLVSKKAPFLHDGKGSIECCCGDSVYLHGADTPDIIHHFPDASRIMDKFRMQLHVMNRGISANIAALNDRCDKETVENFIQHDDRGCTGKSTLISIFKEPGTRRRFFSSAEDGALGKYLHQ
jgi:hypothetical protein